MGQLAGSLNRGHLKAAQSVILLWIPHPSGTLRYTIQPLSTFTGPRRNDTYYYCTVELYPVVFLALPLHLNILSSLASKN